MKNLILINAIWVMMVACGNVKSQAPALSNPDDENYHVSDSLKKYIAFDQKQIALTNATVVDGTGGAIKTGQTIIIAHGYIKDIGDKEEVRIPAGSTIIEAKGKTIIPGIVGVHNHLHIPGFPFIGDVATKLYLASGVTTIQTCGAALPDREIAIANRIAKGEQLGPDVITSGPYFTGEGGNASMIIPRNEQHIRDTMQYWIKRGVSWFKVYRHTKPEDLKIILDEAHRNNCKVTGHFCSITFEEAIRLGIDGIEHGLNSASDFRTGKEDGMCNGGRAYMDELIISSPEVKKLHRLMIEHGVFLTSTLSIFESSIPHRAIADERTLKAMSPYLLNQYHENRSSAAGAQYDSIRENRLKRIMEFEYQFSKMGGLLGSGVDAGRHNLPGYGDQRNFELLREAGFTTAEAVQIMTSNGAKIVDRENIGAIAIGKRADLVILHGDLDKDESVIRQVEYVFKNGIGYDSRKILKETDGKVGLE